MTGGSSSGVTVVSTIVSGGGTESATVLASPVFLGGSRNTAVNPDPASYVPAVNYRPYVAKSNVSAQIRVDLWARTAGVGCTARLYNMTDATTTATSSTVTATTATETTFPAALVAGKKYRLEIVSGTDGEAVYGIGQLESA